MVQPPFGKPSYFAFVGRKGEDSASLIAAVNQAILQLNTDGRLASLQKQWLGAEMKVPTVEVDPSL